MGLLIVRRSTRGPKAASPRRGSLGKRPRGAIVVIDGKELYRLHIGRTHAAFYDVLEDEREVRIVELLAIDDAHKRYGFD